MKTLVYDAPDAGLMQALYDSKKIDVKYSIHTLPGVKKDLDSSEIIKFNIPSKFNFEVSEESQKAYVEFYNKYFNTFSYQFIRSGLKTLDIHEIRNHFSLFYHSFFKIIKDNNIDLAIFFSLPHGGPDFIMYQITKLLKIKTILMHQSLFPNKYFTLKKYEDLGNMNNLSTLTKGKLNNYDFENCKNLYSEYTHNMKKWVIFRQKLQDEKIKKTSKRYLKDIIIRTLINLKLMHREDQIYLEKKYKSNLAKIEKKYKEIKDIQNGRKIIFFPLHNQPELSTALLGGKYEDQILVLERLNSFAKDNWIIIAKENPLQTSYQRNDNFFKRLEGLKNVFFVDRIESTQLILEKSDLVTTICGSVGYEALMKSKKCLVFGNAWYKNFHGVLKIDNNTLDAEIDNFISENFEKDKFLEDLNTLLSCCDEGVVTDDDIYKNIVKDFNNKKNYNEVFNNITKFIEINYK